MQRALPFEMAIEGTVARGSAYDLAFALCPLPFDLAEGMAEGNSASRAIITSVDLMMARAESPRRSFSS
jgi:hypothetical protein